MTPTGGACVPEPILLPRPALPQLRPGLRSGQAEGPPGVLVAELPEVALATVAPRRGQRAATRQALHAAFGIAPPDGMGAAFSNTATIAAGERGSWLVADHRGGDVAQRCREAAAGLASVVDQSDARVLLRLRGPRLMDTLAKGLEIDLHPRAFPAGSAALTALSHVPVLVWKRHEAPVLDLLLPRPTAADIWHWLTEAAAEFGIEVETETA